MTDLTFRKPEDVIDAFVSDRIGREQLEDILQQPRFDLNRSEFIECLLTADNMKADHHCQRVHEAGSANQQRLERGPCPTGTGVSGA